MKKLLLFSACLFSAILTFAQNFSKDGINYTITSGSTVSVIATPSFTGDAIIPDSLLHNSVKYAVTDVAGSAFQNCAGLTSVTLPSGMYYLRESIFANCTALKSVIVPASVFIFGDYAFAYCTALTSVTLKRPTPAGINELVFYGVNTPNVSLNVALGTVSTYQGLDNWRNFKINLQRFKYQGINYSVISKSEVEVGLNSSVFGGGITSFFGAANIPSTVVYEGNILKVVTISNYAFYNCSGMTSLIIPRSVTGLGYNAFYGCTALNAVTVDWSEALFAGLSFGGITASNVTLNVPYNTYEIYDAANTWTDFNIIESQTAIVGGLKFKFTSDSTVFVGSNPKALGIVTIPNKIIYNGIEYKVTGIENNAFAGSSVTGVVFSTVTYSNARMAVADSIYITSIGEKAFLDCVDLTSIDIPASVTSIGDSAFAGCAGLENVTVNWEIPLSIMENVFAGVQISMVELGVPWDTESDYKSALVWKNFAIVTGFDNSQILSKTSIYPNPTTNFVNIEIQESNATVEVLDNKGNLLKSIIALVENENTIDLGEFAPGIYFVKITKASDTYTQKIIKE